MRALPTVVVVQALVLVVLAVLWSQRAAAAPLQPSAAPSRGDAHQTAIASGDASRSAGETAATPTIEREAAPSVAGAGSTQVVLHGRLLGLDPPPKSDDIRMWVTSGHKNRYPETSQAGSYAVAGLTPGAVTVHCEVRSCRKLEFEHQLDARPVQRLDLTLEPATVLKVFVRTTDGRRLATELSKQGVWQGLQIVATRAPLAGDLAPTEHSNVGDFGIGRHHSDGDLNQQSDPDGDDGVLELDEPPPANAALLMRHMVLAQLPIAPGQTELRFEVPLADVQARFAKVRLRVIGPDGAPMAKVGVGLSSAQGGGNHQQTGEDGVAVMENVQPGIAAMDLDSVAAESIHTHLTVPPGGELDLGDIVLTAKIEAKGRVVDAAGSGVAASVQWTPVDLWRAPHPMIDRRSTRCDGDGVFQLWGAGRRRYSVRARDDAGRVGFAIVDGATLGAEPFVVTLRQVHALQLDARAHDEVRCVAVTDQRGIPLSVCRIEHWWRTSQMMLPRGDYQLIVYDGRGTELSRATLQMPDADLEKVIP